MLALCVGQAVAQDCRANLRGTYTYAHSGIKANGNFFSAIASFVFNAGGTFTVNALINQRGSPAFPFSLTSSWGWLPGWDCVMYIDRPGFVGSVSDDGRFISLVTLDEEQMAGVAVRNSP